MLTNISKDTVLCKHTKILTSVFAKAKGLMFSAKIHDTAYVFVFSAPRRIDLHMFFVFFPIDVVFLDETRKIIEVKSPFRPFSLYYSSQKVKYVIEMPQGVLHDTRTQVGDILEF